MLTIFLSMIGAMIDALRVFAVNLGAWAIDLISGGASRQVNEMALRQDALKRPNQLKSQNRMPQLTSVLNFIEIVVIRGMHR